MGGYSLFYHCADYSCRSKNSEWQMDEPKQRYRERSAMFDGIGNISSYVKTQSLLGKFNQRRAEGFPAPQEYTKNAGAEAATMMAQKISSGATGRTEKSGKTVEDPELTRIVSKLNSGQELSGLEMEYLRKNSEGLYGKAKRVAYDREQFRQRLKSCKTPEEVEALRATVTASVASTPDSGGAALPGAGGAEQAAQGLSTMLYRALENELKRAMRRDTFTKTERNATQRVEESR